MMMSHFKMLWSAMLTFGMAYAQVASKSSLTADSHCGTGYCVTALLDSSSSTVNYTLVVPSGGSNIGWWSIAQGTRMGGSNMAICWVNSDNSLTISHRSSSNHGDPTSSAVTVSQFSTNDVGKSTSSLTWWSWNMPLPSGSQSAVQHVFAMNAVGPSSSDPNSTLKKHSRTEQNIALDLTKAYDGSAPKGITSISTSSNNSNTNSSSSQSSTGSANPFTSSSDSSKSVSTVVILHMVFMVLAWLVVFPVGIFITRFGRTTFEWFPYHQAIQIIGVLVVLLGFVLAVVYVHEQGDGHFQSTHERLGLVLCIALLLQILLGLVTHQLRNKRGIRTVGYVHMPLGLLVVALSVWEIHLGFDAWDEISVPDWASFVIYAWAAILVIVYAIGFRKIKQEREMDKQRKQERLSTKGEEYDQAFMRSDAVDTYLMSDQHYQQQYERQDWHDRR